MASPYWNSCDHVKNILYTPEFKKHRPAIFKCKCCSKLLCTECVFTCSSCKKMICYDCINFSPTSDVEYQELPNQEKKLVHKEYPKHTGSIHCIDCEPEKQYDPEHRPVAKEWVDSPKTSPRALDNFLTGSDPKDLFIKKFSGFSIFFFPNFSDLFFIFILFYYYYFFLKKNKIKKRGKKKKILTKNLCTKKSTKNFDQKNQKNFDFFIQNKKVSNLKKRYLFWFYFNLSKDQDSS